MCNSLRVTKQQMRDFVAGGGVNKDSNQMGKHNHLASSSIRKDYTAMDISKGCENSVGQSIDADQRGESSSNEPLQGSSLSIVNPYRKPNKVTAVRNHVGTLNAKSLKDRVNDRYQVKNTEQREMMKLPSDESNQLTRIPPQTRDAPSSNTTSSKRILNPYAKVHSSVSSDRSRTPITASNPLHSTSSNIDDSSRKIGKPKTILDARTNDKEYEHEVNCVSDQVASRNSPKKSRHPGSQSNASQQVIHDTNGLLLDQVASRHSSKKRRHPESQSNTTQQTTLGFLLKRDGTHMTPAEHNCVLQGYSPGPVPLADGDVCKTWIYPMSDNYAERKYQLEITRSAILHNTLVSLPTGLGKTLIAAVVMYNFYRWFPKGKVLFLAPTRPLVRQQIEACYNIMGIPETDTAEISGTIKDRENLWRTRRVFFCTPQACQRDIENGLCDAKMIVCLVLDEAHKTTKKYAYNIVLQHLRDAGAKARIVSNFELFSCGKFMSSNISCFGSHNCAPHLLLLTGRVICNTW
jgi:Fanconi anemia group M protein